MFIHSFVHLSKIVELRPRRHFSSSWEILVIKIVLVSALTELPVQLTAYFSEGSVGENRDT